MKKRANAPARFFLSLFEQVKKDSKSFTVYVILHLIILAVIAINVAAGNWNNVFTGVLTLALLLIPPSVERGVRVHLPAALEILAYLFVFCAGILGEIGDYYQRFALWDDILHAFNGFMFAAFGFCLVDIMNTRDKNHREHLSALFLAFIALCFSMTVGVCWEFFEYGADTLLHTDMQKDAVITVIDTVNLPNDAGQKVTHIKEIASTAIMTADGSTVTLDGYLDVGLRDTMSDLFDNLIGAIIFGIIGYFYIKQRGRGRLASSFIPVPATPDGDAASEESENIE